MVKIWIQTLKVNENILNTIFNQFAISGYLAAIRKQRIDEPGIDFTKGILITCSETGPYLEPMKSVFD